MYNLFVDKRTAEQEAKTTYTMATCSAFQPDR